MSPSLSVWWGDTVVGALRIDRHGDISFAYNQAWVADPQALAISQSLPKRLELFSRREARPFFGGLLPEDGQREAVAGALGISPANDFRLLEALGGDIAGALALWPEGETPPRPPEPALAEPLDDAALVEVLDILPRRPFLAGREGLRLSLAGVQAKLPVVLVNGQIALPRPGQPTTHILKPPIPRFAATTENEAFAMRLARAIGLSVAGVEPRNVSDRPFLLVERYDRVTDATGQVQRVHQEDFCQALGVQPERKYASEGGPTFGDSFDLVRRSCARPAVAVLQLLDAAIFNVVVGNADAHGKNFSLLYTRTGPVLAPLYDLMSTVAYLDLSPNFAMKIAGRATLQDFRPDTWALFAKDVGLGAPYVRRRVRELALSAAGSVAGVIEALVGEGLNAAALASLRALVTSRTERVLANSGS